MESSVKNPDSTHLASTARAGSQSGAFVNADCNPRKAYCDLLRLRVLALFALALLVRLAPLNRYVTPDEPIWVQRSVAFTDAVAAREWAAIPQTGHPGLTTMAIGALGIRLTSWLYPTESATHLAWIRNIAWLAPENDAAFAHLAFFLPAARLLVTVITAAGVALVYGIGRKRLGERTARWLACFLALDPFFGGLSGLLHTDALQATFVILGVLFVLPRNMTYARRYISPQSTRRSKRSSNLSAPSAISAVKENPVSWWSLGLSALCLALAGMTKTLGLLVAPGVALALLLLPRQPWTQRVARVAMLTALTTALYLALCPPFWVDPRAAVRALIDAASYHEGIGLRNVFFAGQFTADPGPLFYPAVLLFRLTAPVLIGLALALIDRFRTRRLPRGGITSWYLALPALIYLAAITLATKKFDRYALTAMVLLSGVAALAWTRHRPRRTWPLLAALLLPWALVAPLPLYYADPLVGGPWLAQQIVPLGWEESDGVATTVLSRQLPDPATKTLLADNVPGAASIFPGATWRRNDALLPCADALIAGGDSGAQPGYTVAGTLRLAGIPLATLYTQTLSFPADLPLVLPGPLPGAPAGAIAPSTDAATLHAWLEAHFAPGDAFLWVHAPDCYSLNEAQLAALLDAAQCQPADAIAGLMAERCIMPTTMPESAPFRARFAGTLDLVAAAWSPTAQATDASAVTLRWQAQTPLEAYSIYLTLRDPESDLVYAEGGDILVDDRAWRTTAWEPGAVIEGTAYVPIDLTLPPGVYTLTASLSGSSGWVGLNLPDGTFGGTRLALGQVEVIAPRYPATDLPGISALAAPVNDFTGLRLLGAGTLPAEVWAGGQLPFRLAWERLPGNPPETLHWSLACANVNVGGDLALAPSAPSTWPEGHRYIAQYAPRTDPLLPEGPCTLTVGFGPDEEIILGEVTIRQRARRFAPPQQPQTTLDLTVGDFARLVGVDISRSTLAPGETFDVTLYSQATGTADRDYTAFVHIVGPEGQNWAQSDSWPEQGAAPTTSWVTGQIIVDTHTLALPADAPAGTYTVFVGLYDAERGPRVPLYNATGALIPDGHAPVKTLIVSH
jgi:4-amino-4-deoxy-L-arabinose transferase-like glycosyltransferase